MNNGNIGDAKDVVRRVFVERKPGQDTEAVAIRDELKGFVGLSGLERVRAFTRYDISGLSLDGFTAATQSSAWNPVVDNAYLDAVCDLEEDVERGDARAFAFEYLPGQYDQREDYFAQCAELICGEGLPLVSVARVYALYGAVTGEEFARAKAYVINPIEMREAVWGIPAALAEKYADAKDVATVDGFTSMDADALAALRKDMNLAMTDKDALHCQVYFRDVEKRVPTVSELRAIDTYWSDHCRHTTFLTEISSVEFEDCESVRPIKDAYSAYLGIRDELYGKSGGEDDKRPDCLMDLATAAMKKLKADGALADLDVSDEINACGIVVDADIAGKKEPWLVLFKNETHNHPTEIEPAGGASTCLGGAIRDPLSGRAYVYQAMRVTGAADPRTPIDKTLPGKLPQRKIGLAAAGGNSLYGNQIGVAAGHVKEIYHDGYAAKRMELGAVVGAVRLDDITREKPEAGDAIILVGGRTGRDGIGGATGSSKEHNEESLASGGAEVQKGNPPEERKIVRLFRNPKASKLIIRCNDFGAGGVAVAVGELAPGIDVNLDKVKAKYPGMDGTELALSESQERMAVVTRAADAGEFIKLADAEGLEATQIAVVTDSRRFRMYWRDKTIVDLSREFLDTNGARQETRVKIAAPNMVETGARVAFAGAAGAYPAAKAAGGGAEGITGGRVRERWLATLSSLESCGQQGLVERFDSTAGAATVLAPFGGSRRLSPVEGMAAKLPAPLGDTTTATLMSYGFDPRLSTASPYHGGLYAVMESLSKIAAMGGDVRRVRMSFQEYFEKPGNDPARWGKPYAALLGALKAETGMGVASIGGKDSMSGSFMNIDVPPTLVAFSLAPADVRHVISPEFKNPGNVVALAPLKAAAPSGSLEFANAAKPTEASFSLALEPDYSAAKASYVAIHEAIVAGKIISASPIMAGGVAATLACMSFGNNIGVDLCADGDFLCDTLFAPLYGSIALELAPGESVLTVAPEAGLIELGKTAAEPVISYDCGGERSKITLDDALLAWRETLESTYPIAAKQADGGGSRGGSRGDESGDYRGANVGRVSQKASARVAKPHVLVLSAPGCNGDYDCESAFLNAGADAKIFVARNHVAKALEETVAGFAKALSDAQILVLPGGFSGDDGAPGVSAFMAALLKKDRISEAVRELLNKRDGLILGVGAGFAALLRSGLLGEARDGGVLAALTSNRIGRYVSRVADITVENASSPWLSFAKTAEVYSAPVGSAEGRFAASEQVCLELSESGRIATRYAGPDGSAHMEEPYNPFGSMRAIEGITSLDGRVFGTMCHIERQGVNVMKNIAGNMSLGRIEAGVRYYG